MKAMRRTYKQFSQIKTFEGRYRYLQLLGIVGDSTFGYDRYLNQHLYKSTRWRSVRDEAIVRDRGCDLGLDGYDIHNSILVHHMNPITLEDIEEDRDSLYDLDGLICTSLETHNAVHYGDKSLLAELPIERSLNDTCPWR